MSLSSRAMRDSSAARGRCIEQLHRLLAPLGEDCGLQ